MNDSATLLTIFLFACTPTDTPGEPIVEDVRLATLTSSVADDGSDVEEQILNVDPFVVESAPGADGDLILQTGSTGPRLSERARTRLYTIEGIFDRPEDAVQAWDQEDPSTSTPSTPLADLEPGSALFIDTFGRQDHVALVASVTEFTDRDARTYAVLELELDAHDETPQGPL